LPIVTELTRFVVAELAPLGSSDVFKTQAECRTELRRMRTIATLLFVLMAAIYLAVRRAPAEWVWAAYLSVFAEAGMVCSAPIGSRGRTFSQFSWTANSSHGCRSRKQSISAAMGRFIANNFLLPAWPSHACHRSTLSVLRRDGSRTSATRERSRLPRDALSVCARPCVESGDRRMGPLPHGVGSSPFPPRRSPWGLSIPWAQGAGQTLLDQSLDCAETTLERYKATIVKHVAQKSWRWLPKNGSTT
jgi:hypothetical protein